MSLLLRELNFCVKIYNKLQLNVQSVKNLSSFLSKHTNEQKNVRNETLTLLDEAAGSYCDFIISSNINRDRAFKHLTGLLVN